MCEHLQSNMYTLIILDYTRAKVYEYKLDYTPVDTEEFISSLGFIIDEVAYMFGAGITHHKDSGTYTKLNNL